MKRFELHRDKDATGVSGLGVVAEGVVFSDGSAVMRWCVKNTPGTVSTYKSINDLIAIHNHVGTEHEGGTHVVWIDK